MQHIATPQFNGFIKNNPPSLSEENIELINKSFKTSANAHGLRWGESSPVKPVGEFSEYLSALSEHLRLIAALQWKDNLNTRLIT
jgi:hypothetical protein